MSTNLIILVASLLIAWFLFNWLIKVIKTSVTTAIMIIIIVVILQITLGVHYQQIWSQMMNLPHSIQQFFK